MLDRQRTPERRPQADDYQYDNGGGASALQRDFTFLAANPRNRKNRLADELTAKTLALPLSAAI
jgi:hypothetical protein